ncbi:RNA polymerase sigma factor [Paractinoplanes deccanensis]|nr:RNA polymerase sigma factor [Actinoplanes deccanensis]
MSFEDFFEREYRTVLKTVLYAGAQLVEAEEAAAEAMADAFRRWDAISSPKAWVRTAAIRHFIKYSSRRRAEIRLLAAWTPPWQSTDSEAEHNAVEERDFVVFLLAKLPPAQREVFELVVEGLTPSEIAGQLGKTSSAVRANLMLARRQVQQHLCAADDRVHLSYDVARGSQRINRSVSVRADRDCADLELLVVGSAGRTKPERATDGDLLERVSGLSLVAGRARSFEVALPKRDPCSPYLLRCFVEPRDRVAVVDPPLPRLLAA